MSILFNNTFIARGGPVQYVLLGLSVGILALILDQLVFMFYIRRLFNNLKKTKKGILWRVYCEELLELINALRNSGSQTIEPSTTRLENTLDRHIPVFGLISSISPILGILGTVHGIAVNFYTMSLDQTIGFKDISLGISYALYTTAFGLIICAVSLVALSFFSRASTEARAKVEEILF